MSRRRTSISVTAFVTHLLLLLLIDVMMTLLLLLMMMMVTAMMTLTRAIRDVRVSIGILLCGPVSWWSS